MSQSEIKLTYRCRACRLEWSFISELKCPECGGDLKVIKPNNSMNEQFRNGGNIQEDRESGRDVISAMRLAHQRHDVLKNALLEMGITENGDDPEDQ